MASLVLPKDIINYNLLVGGVVMKLMEEGVLETISSREDWFSRPKTSIRHVFFGFT
jgi:hypothetical protein